MRQKHKKLYKKPYITEKKITVSFFLTNGHFFNNMEDLFIPSVFPYAAIQNPADNPGNNPDNNPGAM